MASPLDVSAHTPTSPKSHDIPGKTTVPPESFQKLDMTTGCYRTLWPIDLYAIVAIAACRVVRYHKTQNTIDLVEFVEHEDSTISSKVLTTKDLTPFHFSNFGSLHAFTQRGECRLLCCFEGGKTFALLSVCEASESAKSNSPSFELLKTGTFPIKSTHLVPFAYRGAHYLLSYNSETGDYFVASLMSLGNTEDERSTQAILAKGNFAPGWTHVVWKGTHHTRCTRQKFFCYNNTTGETLFECVYVRHGSTTTSVCSKEHVQFEAEPSSPSKKEVEVVLRRPQCTIVPLSLGGVTACLLYSHTGLESSAVTSQSTSRLLSPCSPKSVRNETFHVAQSAALLMHKTVFAHSEPWTHFCLIRDHVVDGGKDDLLLCYSASSGTAWVSRIFSATGDDTAQEVTLFKQTEQAQHTPVQLTQKALEGVAHAPVDVAAFASDNAPPHPPQVKKEKPPRVPSAPASAPTPKTTRRQIRRSPGSTGRPATASTSIEVRVKGVEETRRRNPGDTKDDELVRIIRDLHTTDFPESSDVGKNALKLLEDRDVSPDAQSTEAGSCTMSGISKRRKERPEWVSVAGVKGIAPPPPHCPSPRFERKIRKHQKEEVPNMKLTHKRLQQLSSVLHSRTEYQEKQLETLDKIREKDIIGNKYNNDGKTVGKMIERLAKQDVKSREQKQEKLAKQHLFLPLTSPKKLSEEEVEEQARKLSDDAIARKLARIRQIRDIWLREMNMTFSPTIDPNSAKVPGRLRLGKLAATSEA